jgi:hypothetical protein
MRNILSAESEKTSFGNVLERATFAEPAVLLENLSACSRAVCAYAFVVVTGEFQLTVTALPGTVFGSNLWAHQVTKPHMLETAN